MIIPILPIALSHYKEYGIATAKLYIERNCKSAEVDGTLEIHFSKDIDNLTIDRFSSHSVDCALYEYFQTIACLLANCGSEESCDYDEFPYLRYTRFESVNYIYEIDRECFKATIFFDVIE